MPTLNQVLRKGRKTQHKKTRARLMEKRPQRKGTVTWTGIQNPRKPNSAERKVIKARLNDGHMVRALVPGEGHKLQEHSIVLVRGGAVKDLPGVRYHVVRGNRDTDPPHSVEPSALKKTDGCRKQARSKYGQKKNPS